MFISDNEGADYLRDRDQRGRNHNNQDLEPLLLSVSVEFNKTSLNFGVGCILVM